MFSLVDLDREVSTDTGMIGTGSLGALLGLAVSKHWRLVLVGDARQMQAVGCGGMFAQLWRTVSPTDWPPSTF